MATSGSTAFGGPLTYRMTIVLERKLVAVICMHHPGLHQNESSGARIHPINNYIGRLIQLCNSEYIPQDG